MREHERRVPASSTGTTPQADGPPWRRDETEVLLGHLRDLRMGRAPLGLTLEQRVALEQIDAALEVYRSVFYPPAASQLYSTPFVRRVDEGRAMPRARRASAS